MPAKKAATKKTTAPKRAAKKKASTKKASAKTSNKTSNKTSKKATKTSAVDLDSSMPKVGQTAPAFHLPVVPAAAGTKGKLRLSNYKGKQNVVLFFYPRDLTKGCTTEACDFRDSIGHLTSYDTAVLGISTDSAASHERFIDKHELSFPLLVDEDHAICEKYGTWVEKSMYGKKHMGIQRATFLIDKSGKIAKAWPQVRVNGHVAEVVDAVQQLGDLPPNEPLHDISAIDAGRRI